MTTYSGARLMASVAAGALMLTALAACGDPAPRTDPAATAPSVYSAAPSAAPTTPGSPSPTPTPPFQADTTADTADPSTNAMLTVRNIRAAHHDGYDRVVFELGGTGTPGWLVDYVDQAIDEPSGNPVNIPGPSFLRVVISGVGYPMDTGIEEYAGPNPLRPTGMEEVTAVAFQGTFEGQSLALIGIDEDDRAPFRVFALKDPTRVVVDIQD